MKISLQVTGAPLTAIVFCLWFVEMPEVLAKCWTVSGAQFCDNREGLGNNGGQGGEVVPRGPTPAEIKALAAKERRAKANAFNTTGIAAWNRGEWGIAAEQFRQAYAWNPDSKTIFTNLVNAQHKVGLVAMEEGDWEYAANTFQSLLYHKPDSQEFRRLSAVAETKRQAARQAYELNRQGIKAAANGDWQTASGYFQQAAQNDPRNPAYANNLKIARQKQSAFEQNDQGRTAAQNGNWAAALNYFEKAAQTDPDEPAYAANITLAQRRVQEQQNKAVVTRVQQSVSAIAGDVKSSQPVVGLDLSDISSTGDAFGTNKANPKLPPAVAQKKGGVGTDPGAQLKSVEHHSRQAQSQGKDTDKEMAREGFDFVGDDRGPLAYPDKNQHRQVPPSALDKQVPQGAKDDPQVKQMQAWYRSLDARKTEKETMIAELKEQQKTSKDPVLDVQLATLANDVNRLNDDQAQATATVKERVEVIKKQTLDKGLAWDEEPSVSIPSASKKEE